MSEPVLELRDVSYRYPTARASALEGVELAIEPGEFAILAGESGSGKTTLMRVACGLVPHFHGGDFAGAATVGGRSTRDAGPAELAAFVGFVAQEPETQVVSSTVRAELRLPLELRGRPAAEVARAVEEAALALGIEALLDRTTDTLSGGELQRVALGSAMVTGPPLLLLDEPTSQLDPVAGDELIALLRRLNEEWGVAIVLGEHRLERCLPAADRVIAMDAGRIAFDGAPTEFPAFAVERAPQLATPAAMLFARAGIEPLPRGVKDARETLRRRGAAADGLEPAKVIGSPAPRGNERGDPAIRARSLLVELDSGDAIRPVVDGLDLTVARGERVALMGPNGAGKTSLLRACAGSIEHAGGLLEIPGGCALLGQRSDDYLVRERVGEELPGAEGRAALVAVGLDVDPDTDSRDLSGGERQRLALAIAMAGRGAGGRPPALVCLDEPTRGLDRRRKEALAAWIGELAEAGAALLVATHDVEFAALFAERVVLMSSGRPIADASAGEMLGGGWYFATEVARITAGRAITVERGAELLAPGERTASGGGGR